MTGALALGAHALASMLACSLALSLSKGWGGGGWIEGFKVSQVTKKLQKLILDKNE